MVYQLYSLSVTDRWVKSKESTTRLQNQVVLDFIEGFAMLEVWQKKTNLPQDWKIKMRLNWQTALPYWNNGQKKMILPQGWEIKTWLT